MSKHNITRAADVFVGDAYFAPLHAAQGSVGAPISFLRQIALGSPVALDVDGIVAAATSTELPNAATKTYTTADDGTTPFDNAATPAPSTIKDSTGTSRSVWALDVPRNVTIQVTHNSSIVALSVTVTGFDVYGQMLKETLAVTATGTDKSAAGKKAFKSILSIAITSAGNATTDTLNLGWGDVLGLPFKADYKADVLQVHFNDALDTSATVVAADDATPTATTGDVRGTVDTNSASDGSRVVVWMKVDGVSKATLVGQAQFS
jgi:hypothetical protein